jgi:hypothetical protein
MKVDIRKAFDLGAKKYQERPEEEKRILKEANEKWKVKEEKRMGIVVKNHRAVTRKKEDNQKRRDRYRKKRADELYGKRLRPDASPDKSNIDVIQEDESPMASSFRHPQTQTTLISNERSLSVGISPEEDGATKTKSKKRSNYNKYHPEYIIKALKHWVDLANKGIKKKKRNRETVDHMNYNHNNLTLQESTFRHWRQCFVLETISGDVTKYVVDEEKVVSKMKKAKRSRQGFLNEEQTALLKSIAIDSRRIGATVTCSVLKTLFEKELTEKGHGDILGAGKGQFTMSIPWVLKFVRRELGWGWKSKTASQKSLPHDWKDRREIFVLNLAYWIERYGLNEDDVYNIDETGMFYNPLTGSRGKTLSAKGEPCEVYAGDIKDNITLVCAITASGEKLPLQYIFKGKQYHMIKDKKSGKYVPKKDSYGNPIRQDRSCPWHCVKIKSKDPLESEVHMVQNENHWGNAETTVAFFENILLPHAKRVRQLRGEEYDDDAFRKKPIIVIWDNVAFHCSPFLKSMPVETKGMYVCHYLPPNCTSQMQPLDVGVNGPFKAAAASAFRKLSGASIYNQIRGDDGNKDYHDMFKGRSLQTSAKLFELTQTAWKAVTKDSIMYGWRESGLLEAFSKDTQDIARRKFDAGILEDPRGQTSMVPRGTGHNGGMDDCADELNHRSNLHIHSVDFEMGPQEDDSILMSETGQEAMAIAEALGQLSSVHFGDADEQA